MERGLDWSEERAIFEELGEFYYSEDVDDVYDHNDVNDLSLMEWYLRTVHAQESIQTGHICAVYVHFDCEGCPFAENCCFRGGGDSDG